MHNLLIRLLFDTRAGIWILSTFETLTGRAVAIDHATGRLRPISRDYTALIRSGYLTPLGERGAAATDPAEQEVTRKEVTAATQKTG